MFSYRKQLVNKFSSSFDNYNNQRRDAVLYDNILAKINGLLSLVLFLVIYLIAIFLSIQQRINGGDIVAIIHYPRVWSAPDGMLGSNHLLTEEQTQRLIAWTEIIESCFMYLLEDDAEDAFIDYEDYLNGTYF